MPEAMAQTVRQTGPRQQPEDLGSNIYQGMPTSVILEPNLPLLREPWADAPRMESQPPTHWWDSPGFLSLPPPTISPEQRRLLPPFLRDLPLQVGRSRQPLEGAVAHTYGSKILMDDPDAFDAAILAHEATHVLQNMREAPYRDARYHNYEYGGPTGLEAAHRAGKTAVDFGVEQQASIVEDYYRILHGVAGAAAKHGGRLTPDESAYFDRVKAAYEPFIQQLVDLAPFNPEQGWIDRNAWGAGYIPRNYIPPQASELPLPEAPRPPGIPPGTISGISESTLMGIEPMRVDISPGHRPR